MSAAPLDRYAAQEAAFAGASKTQLEVALIELSAWLAASDDDLARRIADGLSISPIVRACLRAEVGAQ